VLGEGVGSRNVQPDAMSSKITFCLLQIIIDIYTGHTQKNGAFSEVNKKFISHLTRAQHTPSAAATVQVSHALPAVRFSCLLRGRGASFSIVFFDRAGSDVLLQMEKGTFSLGHPVRQILDRAISFFGGSLKIAFMYHQCPRPSMKLVIG
jgi:hypothetical protein